MAKINTYATATPALDDKLLGTDISNTTNDVSGETNNFTVASLFATAFPSGLLSARPAAGNTGRLYYATDNDTLYRDNGSTWDVLDIDWNRVTSKPTTLSGYGITDAAGITHNHASTDISDSTSAGRVLLTANDAAAQRTALNLGTAAQVNTGIGAADVPTTGQADARYQPLDSDLTEIAALSTTSYGRSLLTQSDAAVLRTTAGAAASVPEGRMVESGSGTVFYSLPGCVPLSTGTTPLTIGRILYGPIVVVSPITIDRIACEVTAFVASGEVRLALYTANTDWQPVTRVVESGVLDGTTNGVKFATISTTLQPGRYLTAIISNATLSMRFVRSSLGTMIGPSLGGTPLIGELRVSSSYGELPTTPVAWTGAIGDSTPFRHIVFVRVSTP